MGLSGNGFRVGAEHKEFAKDLAWVVINYTPLSGVLVTIKFGKKWLSEKRMPYRFATYLEKSDRKSFIKNRSKRILLSRRVSAPEFAY